MKSFAPEFAQQWIAGHADGTDETFSRSRDDESLSPVQEAALEALAERVNAARSTV